MEQEGIQNKKIMLIGGHLTPALAVLEELRSRGYSNFVWVGRKYSQEGDERKSSEYKLIKEQGIKFYNLTTGRLQRKWVPNTVKIGLTQFAKIPVGFLQASKIVSKEKPDIVVSFGGYLAFPIVFAAKMQGRKVVTHEQTVVTGLSNKLISKFADKILISWDVLKKHFPEKKTVLTGNPIRKEVLEVSSNDFNFANELPIVYVTGGSQGSNTINWRLLEILSKLLKRANVIHQTGSSTVTKDHERALKARKRLAKKLQANYVIKEHIYGKQIGEVFNKSALVVTRCGANTLTELLALGKPAVLVPIPWSSGNEQMKNAQMLENIGLGTIINQEEITPDLLYEKITFMLDKANGEMAPNDRSWQAVERSAKALASLDASKLIVDEIEKLITK